MTQRTDNDFECEDTPLPRPLPGLGLWDDVPKEGPTRAELVNRILALAACMDYTYAPLPGVAPRQEKTSLPPQEHPESKPEEENSPETFTLHNEADCRPMETSSPSLPAAQQICLPQPPSTRLTQISSMAMSFIFLMGIMALGVIPRLLSSPEGNNGKVVDSQNSMCENTESSSFTREFTPAPHLSNTTENQPQPKTFYTLASEDDYPSALAWACGYKDGNGLQALKKIQELNPQINWKIKKVFHQGERFETPCELTPELVERARYEVYKHHKLRRTSMKHLK